MSIFDNLKPSSPSDISKVLKKYHADASDKKIDLASGEYRNLEGELWVLPSVKQAEKEIHDEAPIIPEYSFDGFELYSNLATKLILGDDSPALKENRVSSTQTVSGTGALRLGAEFLISLMGKTICYYSEPTWDAQLSVFAKAGFKEARRYRYWCPIKHDVDFVGLLEDLKNAPEGAVILLHASAQNPTGIDLTRNQWKQIAVVMRERKLFPFFDSAFQGLAENLEDDAWSVRYFVAQGFELFCAQSFSKNIGLYSERIGNFVVVTKSTHAKDLVEGNLDSITGAMYLAPPAHGNRIVARLLSKPELKKQCIQDMQTIRDRLAEARKQLRAALESLGTPGDWSFLTRQIGVASLTGLNEAQVEHLANKHHIYMLHNGRANVSAMVPSRINDIAHAFKETITSLANKQDVKISVTKM